MKLAPIEEFWNEGAKLSNYHGDVDRGFDQVL